MHNAVILSIGDELLRGKIVDTNFAYLARKLYFLGIKVSVHHTFSDTEEWVCAGIDSAVEMAEIIFITGGLGPTRDDTTRNGLARFLGKDLVLNQRIAQKIREFFRKRNLEMPENNLVQAYLPDGAVPIENDEGTAPGIFVNYHSKLIFLLPGPPSEMMTVFKSVRLILQKELDLKPKSYATFRTIGIPESLIAEWVGKMTLPDSIDTAFYPSLMGVDLYISSDNPDDVESAENILSEKLSPYTFARDEGRKIEAVIGEILRRRNETLSVAESCTGGMLASKIVDIPGSSDYFLGGIVSYANSAKLNILGIDEKTLSKYGAVSRQIAEQMSFGAKSKFDTDYGIGITGIAGPSSETSKKPVGLVYVALSTRERNYVRKYNFFGGRNAIRTRSVSAGLNVLWCALQFGDIEKYPFEDGGKFC